VLEEVLGIRDCELVDELEPEELELELELEVGELELLDELELDV